MNRRSFLSTIAQAAAAFTILPSAVTYERKWKKEGELYTCEIIDPYPPGPHMYPLTLDQRLFVTTFFFGYPIPESVPLWMFKTVDRLNREAGLTV